MDLKTYINENQIGVSSFAKIADLKQPYVSLIANKKRKPSAGVALKIQEATGGAVTVMELLFPDADNTTGQGAQIVRSGRHFPKGF